MWNFFPPSSVPHPPLKFPAFFCHEYILFIFTSFSVCLIIMVQLFVIYELIFQYQYLQLTHTSRLL